MESKIIYYSNTGNSKKIALYLSEYLQIQATDIEANQEISFDSLVLVFPVYCQNIPRSVKEFLKKVKANRVVVLATYGKMWHGNVLKEIQGRYALKLVGGAYVPCKHSYLKEDTHFRDFERLHFVKACLNADMGITVPKSFKNPFANFFPVLRGKMGVKLIKKGNCDGCGVCRCEVKPCIRCLKCVQACPKNASDFKLRFFMRWYLKKKKVDRLVVYK